MSGASRQVIKFLRTDSGAVTVDWVVLAGAVVGIGIAAVASVRTGVIDMGGDIDSSLSGASVAALATLGGTGAYVHTLLSVPQSTYDSWMNTLGSYDTSRAENLYTTLAGMIDSMISGGNSSTSALYIDLLAATQERMDQLGASPPNGLSNVSTYVDRYNAAFT